MGEQQTKSGMEVGKPNPLQEWFNRKPPLYPASSPPLKPSSQQSSQPTRDVFRIYKYPVKVIGEQVLYLPQGAQPLFVNVQEDQVWMWALIDPEAPDVPRKLFVIDTGRIIANIDTMSYIGSVLYRQLVWHIFIENN